MRYCVVFEELVTTQLEVEADDPDSAINLALDLFKQGEGTKDHYGPSVTSVERLER